MKTAFLVPLLSAAALLFGCAMAPIASSSKDAMEPIGEGPSSPANLTRVATGDQLTPHQPLRIQSGAYGFLLFTSKNNPENQRRYEKICASFHEHLPSTADFSDDGSRSQVVTYWPVRSAVPPLADGRPDCANLVQKYDYGRAAGLAGDVRRQGAKGPLLVALRARSAGLSTPGEALILDLSKFADVDIDRAMGIWQERVTQDPAIWKNGFRLVLFREEVRNLIQKYGDGIVAVVQPGKGA